MARKRLVFFGTASIAIGLGFGLSDTPVKEIPLRYVRAAHAFSHICFRYKAFEWQHGELLNTNKAAYKAKLTDVHNSCAQIALALCRQNGGIFIKAGQHAATLKPAIPDAYITTLQVLQDKAPARTLDQVESALRAELGLSLETPLVGEAGSGAVFEWLNPEPIGSASLAQVHVGKLAGDHDTTGQRVAVKVQHRGLHRMIMCDIGLLSLLNRVSQWIFKHDAPDLTWAIESLQKNLLAEADFEREAANLTKLSAMFDRVSPRLREKLVVPEVVKEVSSKGLLVMSFIEGVPIYDTARLKKEGVELGDVGQTVLECWAAMIFALGFIHCDPHPGNFLVCRGKEGKHATVAVLDHGLYHTITEDFRQHHCAFWKAMVLQDEAAMLTHGHALGLKTNVIRLLPFLLLNRPLGTQAPMGIVAPMTLEERLDIVKELGLLDASVHTLADLFARMPADLVWIMRTMHLVKDVYNSLGGSDRRRLQTYTWYGNRYGGGGVVAQIWFLVRFALGEVIHHAQSLAKRWLSQRRSSDTVNEPLSLSWILASKAP